MEKEFIELVEALFGLFRHVLMRNFFFKFTNSHYETALFRASLSTDANENKKQLAKSLTIEDKVEYALIEARELWIKFGDPLKSKKTQMSEPKSASDLEGKVDAIINEDLLSQYKIIKAAYNTTIESSIEKKVEAQNAEKVARNDFLSNLHLKFSKQIPANGIDKKICQRKAQGLLCIEAKKIIDDSAIIESFGKLIALPKDEYNEFQVMQLFKARHILEWLSVSISELSLEKLQEIGKIRSSISLLLNSGIESTSSLDHFLGELNLLTKMRTSSSESGRLLREYKIFDSWRVQAEVLKFWILHQDKISSIDGLKIMHSLSSKRGASICLLSN